MASVRSGDGLTGLRGSGWRLLLPSRSSPPPDLRPGPPVRPSPQPGSSPPPAPAAPDRPVPPRLSRATTRHPTIRWAALGGTVSLMVADGRRLTEARALTGRLLDQIDGTCNTHHPDADLARANRAAGRWVRVDPIVARVVQSAIRAASSTSGLIAPAAIDQPRPAAGAWEQIEVEPDGGLKVPAGSQLDVDAIRAAFAADAIASTISRQARTSLVVSIGSDIAVGNLPGEDHHWQVDLTQQPKQRFPGAGPPVSAAVQTVLSTGAVSTTPSPARRGQRATRAHRDPRSGVPFAPTWRTASVCAATCVDAHAASAAAVILGEQAPAWLWQRGLASRLVSPAGHVLRVAGWPDS